jgi:hypothetical protein
MIARQANPRRQGDAGLGVAIAYFTGHLWTVCIPLTDSQAYDLVVDGGDGLRRVFVRTTTSKAGNGHYFCGLRTLGGNRSFHTIKHFDNTTVDLVFIVCGDGTRYVIPAEEISNRNSIRLGPKWERHRVRD